MIGAADDTARTPTTRVAARRARETSGAPPTERGLGPDAESRHDGVEVRIDGGRGLDQPDRALDVLEAASAQDDDRPLPRPEAALARDPREAGERGRPRRLGEEARLGGEDAHRLADLVVRDGEDLAARLARRAKRFRRVARLPDGDRVRE